MSQRRNSRRTRSFYGPPCASGNDHDASLNDERNISDKKRTTVTTIETHEVWIIRTAVPEGREVEVLLTPDEIAQPVTVSALREPSNGSDADDELQNRER